MIAFVCVADKNYLKKYERCINSQKQYCENNNYEYLLKTDNKYIEKRTDWHWKKIFELKDALLKYDYVVLIDADCEITDKAEPIQNVLDDNSIYYCNGISKRPNSGFMILKNNDRSMNFLNDVIERRYKKEPKEHKVTPFGDNCKINWSISENNSNTKVLDLKWNCSQPEFIKDAYIIHYTNKMSKYYDTIFT